MSAILKSTTILSDLWNYKRIILYGKYSKKWLASCDESERRQIGQACYRAYMTGTRFCLGLWLVLVVLSLVFEMSILPVSVLLLVWGVMQVTYTLECIRLGKGGGTLF